MIQSEEIKNRLDTISKHYEIDRNSEKVTISKEDFYWLIYGIDELLSEISKKTYSK